MSTNRSCRTMGLVLVVLSIPLALQPQVAETDRRVIDQIIGAKGIVVADENVYKFVLPREAATIVQDYQSLPVTFGLNSWAAFSPAVLHGALMTGQLLLLEDEVDPVISSAMNANLEVTGLADSSFLDGPRLKTLDVSGVGEYQQLATAFRAILDEIQRVSRARALREPRSLHPTASLDSTITPGPIDQALAMHGTVANGVYQAAIVRKGIFNGETVGCEMGLATWVSIFGTDDHALEHGEIVATINELQIVIRALRSRNMSIISIRNHMVGEHPQFYFVRFWQAGKAADLAHALHYVLEAQIGTASSQVASELKSK